MDDISFDGVVRGLQKASDDIKREVSLLIPQAAERMRSTLQARYPVGHTNHPGVPHMRDDMSVRTLQTNEPLIAGRKVRGPRLAYIWQNGTAERFYGSARRGRMPAADPGFFERTAVQTRLQMLHQAQSILDRPREIG